MTIILNTGLRFCEKIHMNIMHKNLNFAEAHEKWKVSRSKTRKVQEQLCFYPKVNIKQD